MLIFLDIDGVLNTKSQWKIPYSLNTECIKEFCIFTREVNGNIILISSWRTGFLSSGDDKNTKQIKQLEKQLKVFNVSIKDKTPKLPERTRDKEIERYLYFHPGEDYIIIDDDRGEYGQITENNYFVNAENGFTRKDRILCKKKMQCCC